MYKDFELETIVNIKKYLEKKLNTKVVCKRWNEDNGAITVSFWYKQNEKFFEIFENICTVNEYLYGKQFINWDIEEQKDEAFKYNKDKKNKYAMFEFTNKLVEGAKIEQEKWLPAEVIERLSEV